MNGMYDVHDMFDECAVTTNEARVLLCVMYSGIQHFLYFLSLLPVDSYAGLDV